MSDSDSRTDDQAAVRSAPTTRHDETEDERLDRNLAGSLQELLVALPGIQVLCAFLLVVPFQQGWEQVTGFERTVPYATLLLAAAASECLIAPVRAIAVALVGWFWFLAPVLRELRS